MIRLLIGGTTYECKSFRFSGGEMQISLPDVLPYASKVTVLANLYSSDDIMAFLLVMDALGRIRQRYEFVQLQCPYLPYARQDRVMNPGEALSLSAMCNLINGFNFDSVEVWDAHSDVSLALLNRVRNYGPETFVQMISVAKSDTVLVAPDAGAIKKVSKIAQGFGFEMVRADKMRSVKDGSITGTVVYSEHIGEKSFLIVDDICDGGRTFIELARVLRPLTDGKIILYVTHGIFSKGLDVFNGLIDEIHTANPFPGVDTKHPLLRVMPIEVIR